jgi:hypothetical protein
VDLPCCNKPAIDALWTNFYSSFVQISGSKDQRNVLADTDEDDEDNDHLKEDDHKIVEEEVKSLDQVQAVASRFSQEEEEEEEEDERNDRADEEEEEERNIQVLYTVYSTLLYSVHQCCQLFAELFGQLRREFGR